MGEIVVDPVLARRRARALRDLADEVSRVRLAEAAQAVAAALPGSASSRQATALADAWAGELARWVRDATRVAEAIEECLADFAAVDEQAARRMTRQPR